MRGDQRQVRVWQRLLVELLVCPALGVFILVWQTAFSDTPDPILVAAGLVLVGAPAVVGLDDLFRQRNRREFDHELEAERQERSDHDRHP